VDDDLGFVWWLGEVFTDAGCRTLPALSCDHAVSLVKKLNLGVDLLVVNPQLVGVSRMLQAISHAHPNFKALAIGEAPEELNYAFHPLAILKRPSGSDSLSRHEWMKRVRNLLKEVVASTPV
jgi:hypothetical protein